MPLTWMCCWPSLQNPISLRSWSLAFAHLVNTRSSLWHCSHSDLCFFFLTFVQARRGMWTGGVSFHESGRLLLPALLTELRSVQSTQLMFPSLRKTRCDMCPRDPLQRRAQAHWCGKHGHWMGCFLGTACPTFVVQKEISMSATSGELQLPEGTCLEQKHVG